MMPDVQPVVVMSESKIIRKEAEIAEEIEREAEYLKAQLKMKAENDDLRAKLRIEEEARLNEAEKQLKKALNAKNDDDIRQAKIRQTVI
jgi:hypothetical protein